MTTTGNDTRADALKAARNHIYEAFEVVAERDDIPSELVGIIQSAYRAVRELEELTP